MAKTKTEWQSSSYIIKVADLETPITLTLTLDAPNEDENTTGLRAHWSHEIITPAHSGPYAPGAPGEEIEYPVIYKEVDRVAQSLVWLYSVSYTEGVEAGWTPDESWLVPVEKRKS